MDNAHPLTDLPRALIEAGYETPQYREIYTAAVDGKFPAARNRGGRWTFQLDHLPQIADKLGLTHAAAA